MAQMITAAVSTILATIGLAAGSHTVAHQGYQLTATPTRIHATQHVIGVAPTPPAPVTNIIDAATGQPVAGAMQTWLQNFKGPLPTGQITVYRDDANIASDCADPQVAACSQPGTIYLAPGTDDIDVDLMHEIGHQFDYQHMAPDPLATSEPILEPWQQQFEQIWGLNTGWWDYLQNTGEGSPGEWFATAYDDCGMPDLARWREFEFPAYRDPAAMTATCALIAGM